VNLDRARQRSTPAVADYASGAGRTVNALLDEGIHVTDKDQPVSAKAAPRADDPNLLALIAEALRALADIVAATHGGEPHDLGPAHDGPADAATAARDALQAVRDTIQTILVRATATTHGSSHPRVVQAVTALRAALVEASEAIDLLHAADARSTHTEDQ
jgi:hypothetical protein